MIKMNTSTNPTKSSFSLKLFSTLELFKCMAVIKKKSRNDMPFLLTSRLHPLKRDNPPPTKSVVDMSLNHLMVRLQFWSFGECAILFIIITLRFIRSGEEAPVRDPSRGQIELFNLLLNLKPFNCVQIINSAT